MQNTVVLKISTLFVVFFWYTVVLATAIALTLVH
jgi:hypothetical protein